jgi:hypothetical protein
MMKAFHHPKGNQQAFLRGLGHLYNLVPYQRRAQHAGQCGVEVEGGTVPTRDWFLISKSSPQGAFDELGYTPPLNAMECAVVDSRVKI